MWFAPALSFDAGFPAAIVTGLFCSYVWARVKPWVSPQQPENKRDSILEDLTHATSFLSNIHDHLWNAKSPQHYSESISKEGEDILLSKTGPSTSRGGGGTKKRISSESITGTLAIGTQVPKEEVARLRHKLTILSNGEHVDQVVDAMVLLQTRLPITSNLLSQSFAVARQGIALDPQCTLQLGSWGIIMQSEGEVKLLRLQDGDTPVLLDSFREEDQDLRIEGLFLRGVQMRAAIDEKSIVLRSKVLLKEAAGRMDAFIVWAPLLQLTKTSMLYATKIVEFKGVTVVVRSGLIPVNLRSKPKHEDHTGLYLAAILAVIVALMPSQLWLPILGQIGMVFLPVLQLAAVILGWNLGHFLLLGEWPTTGGSYEEKVDAREVKSIDDNLHSYITPWDSAVRMEMSDLERQLAHKLEKQPSLSNVGIYAQQADYRTEFWQKGIGEMDQAIEIEPQNELPYRIRGCIKGLAGDYEGGLKDLDQALKLKPDDVLALMDRAIFRYLANDLSSALADLDQAIKHDPALPPEVLKLRDIIIKILADREELAKLREENPKLKAELEALRAKAAADLEAAQAKAKADLEAAQAKAAADLEELREKNKKLQEELTKAQETLRKMPQNQTLELAYNNLCCEKCVRDIKSALSKVPGVESVIEDYMSNKVTVTGFVSASVVLDVCRRTSPRKIINLVGDVVEPTPEPDLESMPRDLHEPEHETTSQPAAETESTAEGPPEPPPEPTSQPEAAPEPEADAGNPETKPEAAPEPGAAPESAPEPEAATGAAPEPEVLAEAAPEPEVSAEAAPEPEAAPEAAPETEVSAEATPEPEAAPGAEAEVESEPKPTTNTEPGVQSEAAAKANGDAKENGEILEESAN